MAIKFSDNFLSLIRDRLPISEVIRRHVVLKSKGKDFSGLCPFHQEKSPSFTVNDTKGFYHCFGCGAHGDIFGFMVNYEKLSFPQAVEQCASLAGVPMPVVSREDQQAHAERNTVFSLLNDVTSDYQSVLNSPAGKRYGDYLAQRGITADSIQQFRLGVAPKGRVLQYLHAHQVPPALAERAGLVSFMDGSAREKFWDRLMFPILDEKKRVVGFGGRTLSNTVQPKYLNSAENEVFHKGSLLYGMHLANPKTPTTVLVEGYLDVIAMVQGGYANVFAPMGTAVTEDQAKKLLRHYSKIYVCFDGDAAGFKAMNRLADVFLPLIQPGIELLFIQLPPDQDPHTMITQGHATLLQQKFAAPLGLMEFIKLFETQAHPGNSPEILALQRKRVLDRIAVITDPYLKSLYKEKIYELFQRNRSTKQRTLTATPLAPVSLHNIYESALVYALVSHPPLYNDFMEELSTHPFNETTTECLNVLEGYFFSSQHLEFSEIVAYIKQRMPTLDIDAIINKDYGTHMPFLNKGSTRDEVKAGIKKLLAYFKDNTSLDAHIKEAQLRFKENPTTENWDRLKLLMSQKQRTIAEEHQDTD